MRVTTLPVYSRLADPDEVPPEIAERLPQGRLPQGWRLFRHQVETYRALVSWDYDGVFYSAMN